jgi:transcriptional regulator with XRE-family HTH domain
MPQGYDVSEGVTVPLPAKRGRKGGIPLNGQLLRQRREACRLSSDELGELCGVTGDMIRAIERGARKPSIVLLRRIERALDTTADKLGAALPPPTVNGSNGSGHGGDDPQMPAQRES